MLGAEKEESAGINQHVLSSEQSLALVPALRSLLYLH